MWKDSCNPMGKYVKYVDPDKMVGAREAVDTGKLAFYPDADHPELLQQVNLSLRQHERQAQKNLEAFLERKVKLMVSEIE